MFTFIEIFLVVFLLTAALLFYFYVKKKNVKQETASILIIVGSGGHTKEILTLVKSLGPHYKPRHYIIAKTDQMSEEKVHLLEKSKKSKEKQIKQVLCNGPGTCIPVCLIAFLFKILKIFHTRIIYVESICRVETLSLSGKILYHIADSIH
ncbi:hypothetical protein KUTeg_016468 [Tegillarca granosa]|uniref:UDP-N-acetylglucosamine transferase subunit ALG14 n=1 Tax=Tegillarca granosa TaxID=220873 RepID=A0ABQ9ERL7_TEGGR|nr:hypothetical protein KUTeg_016468 [Tegillarca granosa]